MLIHEFVTEKTSDDKHISNADDLNIFGDITIPDLTVVMKDQMAETFSQALRGHKPGEKAIEIIAEKMNDKNLPTVTKTTHFNLVKEKDGWRVYMGWK